MAKNQHFRLAGVTCCTDSREISRTKGHVGLLGYTKFHTNRFTGVEKRPKDIKNFHFLVKSRLTGVNPLTDF